LHKPILWILDGITVQNSLLVDKPSEFLTRKWTKELDYQLKKELWRHTSNRISVRFEYEWRDADNPNQWMRTHGNEHWEFDDNGLMRIRDMSANDYPIQESECRYCNLA